MTSQRYWWTELGVDELKEYAPRYRQRGCPKPGDLVLQDIVDDEARLGFPPSWFLDLGHWADSERKEAQSEEQLITSVFPPLSPYEVQEFTRIRCSVCSEYIAADAVEEHSRRCVSLANECCSPATGGGLVELSKSDPAWSSIVDLLQASSMENIARYRYSLRLTKLWKVRPSSILQEHASEGAKLGKPTQLFFGASLSDAEGIALEGFKLPETAGIFGRGIYLAPCPLKAASFSPEDSWLPLARRVITRPWATFKKESGHMLLCDVHLGKTMTLRSKNCDFNPAEDLKAGWLRDNLGLGDYDSVYAPGGFFGAVSVAEYVVYRVQQALPRYLLEFEHVY
eukprot:TRINITY_DN13215_c0_g1_i3.p1 TRINITY_DN13215_c0_g1~~TRINITY_DN13215_c0_g1_i3.p1  ORF type:complete len:340 (-),score=66.09 TRINITY_DN13215_c0_g1_i3:69-1088(-)